MEFNIILASKKFGTVSYSGQHLNIACSDFRSETFFFLKKKEKKEANLEISKIAIYLLIRSYLIYNLNVIWSQHKISDLMSGHKTYFEKLLSQHIFSIMVAKWPWAIKGKQIFLRPFELTFQFQKSRPLYIGMCTKLNWAPRVVVLLCQYFLSIMQQL